MSLSDGTDRPREVGEPKRPRILLVEDDLPSRRLARVLLVHRGYEVVEATSLAEARTHLTDVTPDLVVSDINFPGGGGRVLLHDIRSVPHLAALPVIAVTAHAMSGERERLLSAGFDGYVSKPIDRDALIAQVETLLSRVRSR